MKLRKLVLPLLVLVATLAIACGAWIGTVQSAQVGYYNQAMLLYKLGNTDKASQLLDKSLEAYDAEKQAGWTDHLIFGRPSDEVAALAHFHKGVMLLMKAQKEQKPGIMGQAVDEFETSLKINPGSPYANSVPGSHAGRLNAEAMTVKHDLDLLFQQHPEQQNGQGKGKGKGNQPGQQLPGNQPGNKPGHGGDDGL
jgi:tetratricopeptide (TPR) repeat protein